MCIAFITISLKKVLILIMGIVSVFMVTVAEMWNKKGLMVESFVVTVLRFAYQIGSGSYSIIYVNYQLLGC